MIQNLERDRPFGAVQLRIGSTKSVGGISETIRTPLSQKNYAGLRFQSIGVPIKSRDA